MYHNALPITFTWRLGGNTVNLTCEIRMELMR
jgi:hypothetical protein